METVFKVWYFKRYEC